MLPILTNSIQTGNLNLAEVLSQGPSAMQLAQAPGSQAFTFPFRAGREAAAYSPAGSTYSF